MTSSTLRRCLVRSLVLGLSATNALSAQVSTATTATTTTASTASLLAATAVAAFRAGLVAAATQPNQGLSRSPLQAVALRWPAYADGIRYRILRAAAQSGPWVVDHEVGSLADSVRRLPPNTPVFLRVVALKQMRPSQWLSVDSTNATVTVTPQSNMQPMDLLSNSPAHYNGVVGRCGITLPSTLRLSWTRLTDASGYRLSARIVRSSALPDIFVTDTALVQTNVASGSYEYAVAGKYDIANWPGPGQTMTLHSPGMFVFQRVVVGNGRTVCS